MKQLVILGAGTAGTMMANHLVRKLDRNAWALTIVDEHSTHYYQPGFLFIPFGTYDESDVTKPKTDFIPKGVTHVQEGIDLIKPEDNEVLLKNGEKPQLRHPDHRHGRQDGARRDRGNAGRRVAA